MTYFSGVLLALVIIVSYFLLHGYQTFNNAFQINFQLSLE